jgi:sugar phosphate permease
MASQSARRWFRVLPVVFITYSLAYLDRSNYGFGAAAGLAATLDISKDRAALLGALFFLGYFLFQVPGAALANRVGPRLLVALALMAWGVLAAMTGVIHYFWLLAIDRLLLGVAESFILPAMLMLLMQWFTRKERSLANAVLILGNPVTVLWMSVASGYLIRHFGWQKTFIFEGLPSIAWGFCWFFLVRDRPEQAAWLPPAEREVLREQLSSESCQLPRIAGVAEAIRHPSVILLCIQYFFWSFGMYGFVLWLPTIIRRAASSDMGTTGLLSAAPYLVAIGAMLVNSYFSDRSPLRRKFVWPFLCLAGVAFLGCFATQTYGFKANFFCLIVACGAMYAPYGPFFASIPELVPASIAGEITAYINSSGALGGFFGTWLIGVANAHVGIDPGGFLLMSAALLISGLIHQFARVVPGLRNSPGLV